MKKLVLFLAFSFLVSFGFSQNSSQLDSLNNILSNSTTSSERLEIIQELFILSNSDSVREHYYEQAKQNFAELTEDLTLAHIHFMEARIQCNKKIYSPELLQLSKNIFNTYKSEKSEDKYIVRALNLIADVYQLNNQIKIAVDYNLKAIKITEKSTTIPQNKRESMLGTFYINLANKTSIMKDPKAIEYSTKGLRILERRITGKMLVGAYGNHCIVLRRAKEYDSALVYAQKINSILAETNQNSKKAQIAYMIATIYNKMNKIDLAKEYAKKSLSYFQENPSKEIEASMSLYLLGKLFQQKKKYSTAISYFEEAIIIGNKYNMLDVLYNTHLKLSEVYKAQNNTDKAYDFLLKTQIYQDSIKNKRRERDTRELIQKYETEKKEQKIIELEQQKTITDLENKNQVASLQAQISILGLVLFVPISLLIGGGWYVNRRRLTLKLEAEQKERAKQMSELKAIRSQMNPHFIFNALNSIQDFIMLSEKENAQHYLGKFAILMRGFLESSSKETISLEKELPLLKSYIELEGLRLGEEFSYEINFDSEIDKDELEDIEIPPLLIQPYLENAFKHGLLHKTGDKKLTLGFEKIQKIEKQNKNFLQLKIIDNGIGRQKSAEINARKAKTHNSFATQATSQRLELLKNQSTTNKNIEVEIKDLKDNQGNGNGTEIVILIPINND